MPDESVLVIKLIIDHPAINFIAIHRRTSNNTQKMYIIQVSTQEYQQRPSENRMDAVKDLAVDLDNPSLVYFYADKFKVLSKFVFYTYASPIIPLTSHDFTLDLGNTFMLTNMISPKYTVSAGIEESTKLMFLV